MSRARPCLPFAGISRDAGDNEARRISRTFPSPPNENKLKCFRLGDGCLRLHITSAEFCPQSKWCFALNNAASRKKEATSLRVAIYPRYRDKDFVSVPWLFEALPDIALLTHFVRLSRSDNRVNWVISHTRFMPHRVISTCRCSSSRWVVSVVWQFNPNRRQIKQTTPRKASPSHALQMLWLQHEIFTVHGRLIMQMGLWLMKFSPLKTS